MVQEVMNQSGSHAETEINTQIHSHIQEAIKTQQQQTEDSKANSKLGFLQQVVSLDCFFGSKECLFKDKKSMMDGKVTEFAKKKFEQGNTDVSQVLSQVKAQMAGNDNKVVAPPAPPAPPAKEVKKVEQPKGQQPTKPPADKGLI